METSTDSFVLVHQVRRDLDTQKIKAPLQSDELEPIRAIKNHEIHIDAKICRVLRDVKSPRTWGWRWWRWWCAAPECLCANEQFSRSKPTPYRSWVLFFFVLFFFSLKTKGELKAEKFTHWQTMALSATPAFYCMNKQQLFIHLISPSTLSAN